MTGANWQRRMVVAVVGVMALVALAGAAPAMGASEETGKGKIAPIDLNRASEDELTAIPGIGKAMARRIVEFREEHGPFRRVEDLLKVRGIGEKSFEKMRPFVKVERSR